MSLPKVTKNPLIYIGINRRKKVEGAAISLSHATGVTVSAAKVAQDIIDQYLNNYISNTLKEAEKK